MHESNVNWLEGPTAHLVISVPRDQPQPGSIFSLNSPRDGSFIQFLLDARRYS
jgi:hypothetical protein